MSDLAHELFDAGKRAASDGLLSDDAEPAFDLVEPGRIGWGVVDVIARSLGEPGFDFGVLVGGVVVDDQMDIEIVGHVGIDVTQEREEFLVSVAFLALADDLAAGDVQGGEQRCGAVSDVIMRDTFDIAQAHGQHGLGAIQRLHLGFLIDAQDHRVVGRIEVKAHDITHFFDEEGIVGDLEVALAVRLDTEEIEPALDGALGDAGFLRHRAHTPMGASIGRFGLEGPVDGLGHPLILMRSGPTTSEFVMQSLDAELDVAFAPLADGVFVQAQAFGNGCVGFAIGAGQYDLGALDQTMRQGPGIGEAHEVSAFFVAQHDRLTGARHGQTPWLGSATIILFIYGT